VSKDLRYDDQSQQDPPIAKSKAHHFAENVSGRDFVVGDLHGCFGMSGDLTAVPPKAATIAPASMAVQIPASGLRPEAMAKAMAKGNATMPTVRPAPRSLMKRSRV
jgi:hypothetical protein